MRVANNIQSLNILNKQKLNRKNKSTSMERLSSGLRINRAADDAAGLSISQKMRAQIRGLNQASRNAQDGISLIQTAEGAIGSMTDISQRMRELCVQGANGTLTYDDREHIQEELEELKNELHSIASKTEFNTKTLLDGSLTSRIESKLISKTIEVDEEVIETSVVTTSNSVTVEENISISIPSNGSSVSSSLLLDGQMIDFEFKEVSNGQIEVLIKNAGADLGGNTFSKTEPRIEWEKSYGGSSSEVAESIFQSNDGGYIVAGYSYSNDGDISTNKGNRDYWVVKLNPDGNMEWEKSLGGSGSDSANSIIQTNDGGFIVAGTADSSDGDKSSSFGTRDMWVVKLDNSGNIEWEKSYGGSSYDESYEIEQTSDGGFIIAGASKSNDGDVSGNNGSTDFWITKLDINGNIDWSNTIGGSDWERAHSIQQTADGGYIVAGGSMSSDGNVSNNYGLEDSWVVKLDSFGSVVWDKNLGGSGSDRAESVIQTSDGGYIVANRTNSTDFDVSNINGDFEYWITKLDTNGNLLWEKSLGTFTSDDAFSIKETNDGGYAVAGTAWSDFGIYKLDVDGNIEWDDRVGGSAFDYAFSMIQTDDEGYALAGAANSSDGDVSSNKGSTDYWIVKYEPVHLNDKKQKIVASDITTPAENIKFDNVEIEFSTNELETVNRIKIDATITKDETITTTKTETREKTVTEVVLEEVENKVNLQIGSNAGQMMSIVIEDMRPDALGFTSGLPSVNPVEMAGVSIGLSDAAINILSSQRSRLGAQHNALEHVIKNVDNASERLQAAESRIADADMAKEMMNLTKANILEEATNAMMVQSNQLPNMVLELLK